MTTHLVPAGGFKQNIAQECDTLGHTGRPLVYSGNELASQLTLRFPTGEKFQCRTVYVHDTKQQNGRPILAEPANIARWAVERLRDDQGAAEASLLKWPEGHHPNVAVVGGTYTVKGVRAVAFRVKQELEKDGFKRRFLVAHIY